MPQSLADIALPLPLDQTFTYTIPSELQTQAQLGVRVAVPFGKKYLTGVIVGFPTETKLRALKPIKDVLDIKPSFSEDMLKLCQWMAEYYFAPVGEVFKAATLQGLTVESKRVVRLLDPSVDLFGKTSSKQQQAIIDVLKNRSSLAISQLQTLSRVKNIHSTLNEMQRKGWVLIEETIPRFRAKPKTEKITRLSPLGKATLSENGTNGNIARKQLSLLQVLDREGELRVPDLLRKAEASSQSLKTLLRKGFVEMNERELLRETMTEGIEAPPNISLNVYQQQALQKIREGIHTGGYKTFLLLGVTGSGKTQVYIESIRTALEKGKTSIVLVPEISLTPQTVRRFRAHFGRDVTVMHSQMSLGERYDAWRQAHQGNVKIVIGPRSAVFAPLQNLGLIVVDEEQEASYKQFDSTPRYNARDVAIVRARHNEAAVILGSATPSAETIFNTLSGKYEMLELPQRVDDAQLPRIDIVDMIKERKRFFEEVKLDVTEKKKEFPKKLPYSSVSKLLRDQIEDRIQKKEGVILLQNRRGFSHVVECFDCGYVEKCERCEVSLTYHLTKKHLRCHYCGFVKAPPVTCPQCHGSEVRFHSFGTQQVQEEVEKLFPKVSVLRMDLDTTSKKGSHDRLLKRFGSGEADILLGTQMVAKGLDFPRVTLVGVISADTQMLLPDFRASERTFQLLTQVAGRAGRSNLAGEVVIQTLQPQHYSLKHVVTHDVLGFYKEELEHRRELDYPPFSRIVLIEFSGEGENEVHHHAKKFSDYIESINKNRMYIVLGPADAAIPKIKNQFRKHVIIKGLRDKDPSGAQTRSALAKAKRQYNNSPLGKSRKVKMTIDVDPQGMM